MCVQFCYCFFFFSFESCRVGGRFRRHGVPSGDGTGCSVDVAPDRGGGKREAWNRDTGTGVGIKKGGRGTTHTDRQTDRRLVLSRLEQSSIVCKFNCQLHL